MMDAMGNPFDVQSKRGSRCGIAGTRISIHPARPWTTRIPVPTLGNHSLGAIETSGPSIRALGITDYFGIERLIIRNLTLCGSPQNDAVERVKGTAPGR